MKYIIVSSLIIIVTYLLIKKNSRDYKIKKAGRQGEKDTYKQIHRLVRSHQGIIYRNLVLPLYESSTEIDMLVVSKKGLLCIENKHVSGRIVGAIDDKYWIQEQPMQKKKMYNPIMQNEGHIKCIKYHLQKNGLKEIPIYSFIVFSNENAQVTIDDYRLGSIKDLKVFLKRYYFRLRHRIDVKSVVKTINRIKIK